MNKTEPFEKLASWGIINTVNQKLSEEMAREIIDLIQKKEAEKKYLALAQNSSGIVPSKFAEGKIRELKFNLITAEGQIRQFFTSNMEINSEDCFHPTILIAQDQNRTPRVSRCLMCGFIW